MSTAPNTPRPYRGTPSSLEQFASAAKQNASRRRRESTTKTPERRRASTSQIPSKRVQAHSSRTRAPLGDRSNAQESSSFGRTARRRATAAKRERREEHAKKLPKARVSLPMPVAPRAYDDDGYCQGAERSSECGLEESIESLDLPADLTPVDKETIETALAPEEVEAEVAARPIVRTVYLAAQENVAAVFIFVQSPTLGSIHGALYDDELSGDINLLTVPETALWEAQCQIKEAREAEQEQELLRAFFAEVRRQEEIRRREELERIKSRIKAKVAADTVVEEKSTPLVTSLSGLSTEELKERRQRRMEELRAAFEAEMAEKAAAGSVQSQAESESSAVEIEESAEDKPEGYEVDSTELKQDLELASTTLPSPPSIPSALIQTPIAAALTEPLSSEAQRELPPSRQFQKMAPRARHAFASDMPSILAVLFPLECTAERDNDEGAAKIISMPEVSSTDIAESGEEAIVVEAQSVEVDTQVEPEVEADAEESPKRKGSLRKVAKAFSKLRKGAKRDLERLGSAFSRLV
ncbi:hypothetical protein BOTBODRAFT_170265 [Botryobasidium botryosum FD-172 SS1]|uniref:Uncharacterized protein n=1 Tax=Botryobasidium botryosum (strain FD-172 SS1) TaxID=930990 RepID=A0A067MX05_BOTB1|nr:hypothetical protein BOTBODRAFT_170265 [Botryobasidium botryosum FD-172 SS1]